MRPGEHLADAVLGLGHPLVTGVRGAGLLRAIILARDVAPQLAAAARDAGFIVNPVAPDAIRLAPPLVSPPSSSTPSSRPCRPCSMPDTTPEEQP